MKKIADISYNPAEITNEIYYVTPAEAKLLLKKSNELREEYNYPLNRDIKITVDLYIRMMEQDEWQLTRQPVIYGDGIIWDGNHRLTALSRAKVDGILLEFARVPEGAKIFNYLDNGIARSPIDVLKSNRHEYTSTLKSVISYIHRYYITDRVVSPSGSGANLARKMKLTNNEYNEYAYRANEVKKLIVEWKDCQITNNIIPKPVLISLNYIYNRINLINFGDKYLESLATGAYYQCFSEKDFRLINSIRNILINKKIESERSMKVTDYSLYAKVNAINDGLLRIINKDYIKRYRMPNREKELPVDKTKIEIFN